MPQYSWNKLELICDGDSYFEKLVELIQASQESVDFETYIFKLDQVGELILKELASAKSRGLRVRLLVDGWGSYTELDRLKAKCNELKLDCKVFHPTAFFAKYNDEQNPFLFRLAEQVKDLNTRNHRKMQIFDNQSIVLGGMNIWHVHSQKLMGTSAWKDHSIYLEGNGVEVATEAFEAAWKDSRLLKGISRIKRRGSQASEILLFNDTWKKRLLLQKTLYESIEDSESRVYLSTPYFNPTRRLLNKLKQAAKRNVEVKLLLPSKTDVPLARMNSRNFYPVLLKAGVQIFEYQSAVLHSKLQIIDNTCWIGSMNLNLRSLIHDLEVQAVTRDKKIIDSCQKEWTLELEQSREIDLEEWKKIPLYKRLLYRLLLIVRYWL